MQPTEQHRNGVALSYHETRGECSHTHGRSIRVPSGNLADRRGFIVLPAAVLGDDGAAAALASSDRGTDGAAFLSISVSGVLAWCGCRQHTAMMVLQQGLQEIETQLSV